MKHRRLIEVCEITCDRCEGIIKPYDGDPYLEYEGIHYCCGGCALIDGAIGLFDYLDLDYMQFFRPEDGCGWDHFFKTPRRSGKGYQDFRKVVLERDGRKCVECSETEDLHVHHIKPYARFPELREDPSNGLTLCAECHRGRHGSKAG